MSALIFNHTDYCKYLEDWVEHKKQENPRFSYQLLAQKLGLGSKVQVFRILHGKRKVLGSYLTERWNQVIGHNRLEAAYFLHMIHVHECVDRKMQTQHLHAMSSIRNRLRPKLMEKNQYEYFREWYMPVLREILCMLPASTPLAEIGALVHPSLSSAQVQMALDTMLSLGILKKEEDCYHQNEARIHASETLRQKAVTGFQADVMKLGIDALRSPGLQPSRFTTSTMGIPVHLVPDIIEKMRKFQHEVAELVTAQTSSDQVFQLNVQFFPVSNPLKETP